MNLIERIIDASKRAGLSVSQLALMSELPEIAPMLRGKMRVNLTDDELIRIALILDADFGWLTTGIEKPLDADTEEALAKIPEPDRGVLRHLFTRCGGK